MVKKAFLLFSEATGLVANKAKSSVFFGGISSVVKQRLLEVLEMEEVYLRGVSFWTVDFKLDASWYFKKILRLRSTINESLIMAAELRVQRVDYARNIWDRLILPKHRFIGWQIVNDQLLTRDNISKIMSIPSDSCPVCCMEKESHHHLFINCYYTRSVISEVTTWSGDFSWPSNIRDWFSRSSNSFQGKVLNSIVLATLYNVWLNRNCCIFDMKCKTVRAMSKEIKFCVKTRCLMGCNRGKGKLDNHILNVAVRAGCAAACCGWSVFVSFADWRSAGQGEPARKKKVGWGRRNTWSG
ncbi:hypothetical protein F8388_017018 [Cannabis sativa]|uniref:Reverse transcriptase zinc-binding domain-containing protein n=1 Tax=Cannabis sativa TaxID=3483 RepID=A0A7J6GCL0_CANSA|nr:hypothetical protein F8388_017018 [Cannabis sativa]KAF4393207.1 hypothetical protein G4B88_001941 [Cannabis sativa]